MVFLRIRGWGMLTLNLFGENPCFMWRTHQNCQLPSFLSFLPKPFILPEGGWGSYCLEGKGMGNFELGRAPSFGISCFTCMDKKHQNRILVLTHEFMFWGILLSWFGELWGESFIRSIIDSSLSFPWSSCRSGWTIDIFFWVCILHVLWVCFS